MKTKLNLGIVLGILLILAACQKEQLVVDPATVLELPEENGVDYTSEIPPFEADHHVLGNDLGEEDQTPPTTSFPASIFFESVDPNMGGTGVPPPPISWVPQDELLEAIDGGQTRQEIMGDVIVTWVDKFPESDKWTFVDTRIGTNAKGGGPDPLCPYEDCDIAIPATVAYYQPIANQQCRDIYVCVACCIGNGVVYACLIIRHNCGIFPSPVDY